MNILANDGISESGKNKLEEYGFNVDLTTVAQDQLINYINENSISTLLVRSATQVRKDIIDNCPSLKIIGRGGVGMDNIDVEYAKSKNINVINTPAASSKKKKVKERENRAKKKCKGRDCDQCRLRASFIAPRGGVLCARAGSLLFIRRVKCVLGR
jgi:hypothetical protein